MRIVLTSVLVSVAAAACAAAQAPEPVDRSADLAAFRSGFLEADNSYSDTARLDAERAFAALQGQAGAMSDAAFELALAEIAALADNGHSMVMAGRWALAYNRLAVRFLIADDGLFVAQAAPGEEGLVGRRVAAIEGHDLAALRAAWDRYASGREGFRDGSMYVFLESPEMLHAAGLAESPDALELTFADGSSARVGTTDVWPAPEGVFAYLPNSRPIELAEAGLIREPLPLYLQEPETFFRLVEMPERDAVYVQFRGNMDYSGASDLRQVSDAAIATLREIGPRFVILDQRFNFGGDLNNTRNLMQAIPEIVGDDGRVVAITSGRTFSAGIASLGYLKQAGGERVTFVGAPVGDHLAFWAEGGPVTLPQTGAFVLAATERHDYTDGCPEADCHGSIRNYPIAIAADALEPSVQPAFTYADVIEGRDPYLDAALALIESAG